MATTRLIKHKPGKGKSIASSIKDSLDYGKNPNRTGSDDMIRSYECDYETADAEFILSKEQYHAITGRNQKRDKDVLFYQIRQSFKPDEVTPEQANEIGYDLAMRWTKGKHVFIVATHIDRKHIHNHIYYNSTTLDCRKKHRDFLGSARALRRLSDRICIENELSVIINPKLKSQGKYKHYGEWLKAERPLSHKDNLTSAIDIALKEKPKDFDDFLVIMNNYGFEHKWGRGGVLSFKTKEQERFTRLRSSTLGEGYSIEDITAVIEGRKVLSNKRAKTTLNRVNLVVDIQKKLQEGKGAGYAKWATIYNLKQMAAALQYLQENNLLAYEDLEAKTTSATDKYHKASNALKQTETAMKRNADLKSAIVDYAKTRPVFEEYKAQNYSKKFLHDNEPEIAIYRAAQSKMRDILNGAKLPKMETLKEEWETLKSEKKSNYSIYRTAQKDMRDVIAVKANIDHLLGLTGRDRNKEIER